MKLLFQKKQVMGIRQRITHENRAPIYSYHARRSSEQSITGREILRSAIAARTASRAIRFSVRRIGAIIVLVVAATSAVSMLTVSSDVKIQLLDTQQGIFFHDATAYQQAAQKLLSGSFTNRTKVTINTNGVSLGLKQRFPELSIVSVKLPLVGHRPIIYLTPARPALQLASRDGGFYVVSENGRVIGSGVKANSSLRLPFVVNQNSELVTVGELALPSNTVAFIQEIAFQLSQKRISVASFVLPASTSELDLYLSDVHYFVKFNLAAGSSVQQQIGTFLAVRHYLQGQGVVPQYVDVRIEGRAYYK